MTVRRPGFGIGSKQVVLVLTAGLLLLLVAFPLFEMLRRSFVFNGHLSVANYVAVFADRENYAPFVNTLILGLLTVAGSLVIAVPAAWLVARTNLPFRGLVETLLVLPFMIPPFVGAISWIQLASPRVGYLNKLWTALFGEGTGPFDIYNLGGVVLALTLHNYTYIYLILRAALERMNTSVEEAAAVAGASRLRVICDVTLRLVTPSITAGALLVFIDTIAEFGIPALIGMQGRFYVLTTQIYAYIHTGTFNGIRLAAALSSILMTVAGIGLILNDLYLRRRNYTVISGKGAPRRLVRLGRARWPVMAVFGVFFLISVIMPLVAVFISAFLRVWGLPVALSNMTLANFRYILFEYDLTRLALQNSLILAVSAAVATTVIGAFAAYISVKTRIRGRQLVDLLATVPHAIPGTVVALAMILAWSGAFWINLYNTLWIILIAYIVRYMFFAFRNISAALGQVHPSLEEAAMVSGAGWLRTFRDILVPLVKPSLLASAILVFMPSFRELTVSVLLWGPETPTVGVSVFEMQDAGNYTAAAAMAALLLVIVLVGDVALRRFASGKPPT